MTTSYEPYDGDYIDADYTKLLNDLQTEQDLDFGIRLEICVTLTDDDLLYVLLSNDEGNDWEFGYEFPIPATWEIATVRAMFEGNVYLKTDGFIPQEDDDE